MSSEGGDEAREVTDAGIEIRELDGDEGPVVEGDFTVINNMGLHVRPATNLSITANKYAETQIWLSKEGGEGRVDAKGALPILTLAGVCGTRYTLRASGPQAREAIQELLELAGRKFDVLDD